MMKLYVNTSENLLVKNDALAEASVAILDIKTEGIDYDSCNDETREIPSISRIVSTETVESIN